MQEVTLTFKLTQNHGGWNSDDNQNHNLGRFRLSSRRRAGAVADPVPAAVRQILDVAARPRTPEQQAAVFSYWRTTVPEWCRREQATSKIFGRHIPRAPRNSSSARAAAARYAHSQPAATFLKPTEHVDPGVPGFLNPLPAGAPLNRLTLASWLTDRHAPTTARAAVNRMWQAYFGIGLVATPEDFGMQSEAPSHPEAARLAGRRIHGLAAGARSGCTG